MKIYISAFLLFFSLPLIAQSNYYYYRGKKIDLTIDQNDLNLNKISFKRSNNYNWHTIKKRMWI